MWGRMPVPAYCLPPTTYCSQGFENIGKGECKIWKHRRQEEFPFDDFAPLAVVRHRKQISVGNLCANQHNGIIAPGF